MTSRKTKYFLFLLTSIFAVACSAPKEPASPKETFETYSKALKKNDITAMKLLLSAETIKMHEQEAKRQGVALDDIVKREALLSQNQKVVKVRNEKIDGQKATLEVENQIGIWELVSFVFEEGEWKIDKKTTIDMIRDIEDTTNKQLDDLINSGRIDPTGAEPSPTSEASPTATTAPIASPTPVTSFVGATPTPVGE